jgi:hypothetical protein
MFDVAIEQLVQQSNGSAVDVQYSTQDGVRVSHDLIASNYARFMPIGQT